MISEIQRERNRIGSDIRKKMVLMILDIGNFKIERVEVC